MFDSRGDDATTRVLSTLQPREPSQSKSYAATEISDPFANGRSFASSRFTLYTHTHTLSRSLFLPLHFHFSTFLPFQVLFLLSESFRFPFSKCLSRHSCLHHSISRRVTIEWILDMIRFTYRRIVDVSTRISRGHWLMASAITRLVSRFAQVVLYDFLDLK